MAISIIAQNPDTRISLAPSWEESRQIVNPKEFYPRNSVFSANLQNMRLSETQLERKIWGGRRGLNPRPPESQSGALPTELRPLLYF